MDSESQQPHKPLPILNGANVKQFRRIANFLNSPKRSSAVGCIFLLVSNTIFMILAIIFALLYFNAGGTNSRKLENSVQWPKPTNSLLGKYATAAVAADNEICSSIGRDILLRGGNAVESAIATLFCIGVMDTHSSGLGGGHLMTIYNATTKQCHVVDARETAPLNSSQNMYFNRWEKAKFGWESVAVPGEVHGLWTEYKKFGGNLEWHTLVHPTIKLMEEGYPTSHALAKYMKKKEQIIKADPGLSKYLINPKTGKLFAPGEQIKTRQNLAETLKRLHNATDPVELFYKGELAEAMAKEFEKNGGRITLEDFANYKAIVRSDDQVIKTHLPGGRTICGPPPPSGSAVTQGILNILDPITFNLTTFSGRVDFLHRYIEASKFAYAARNSLGDMDFVPDAMDIARRLTSQEWAQKMRSKITWSTHADTYYDEGVAFWQEDHGTSHVSVIDSWGNAVAVTSSINLALGSLVFSESTGILWNDQMDDFSSPGAPNFWGYEPSPKNFIVPGKRPMSSMSPIIIFSKDGKEILSIGGAGGSAIISGVASCAFNTLWLGMNIKEAIDFPRLHNQLRPNHTKTEERMPIEFVRALEERGHSFGTGNWLNVVTGIHLAKDGTIYANSDWRKGWESQPSGY